MVSEGQMKIQVTLEREGWRLKQKLLRTDGNVIERWYGVCDIPEGVDPHDVFTQLLPGWTVAEGRVL